MIGSVFGGKAVTYGRRRALLVMDVAIIVGTGLTLILTIPTLMVGRFICGCAAGVFNVVMGKSINESIPTSKLGLFEPILNVAICLGMLICLLLGLSLPDNES